jgi:hypothetical protein
MHIELVFFSFSRFSFPSSSLGTHPVKKLRFEIKAELPFRTPRRSAQISKDSH